MNIKDLEYKECQCTLQLKKKKEVFSRRLEFQMPTVPELFTLLLIVTLLKLL